MPPSFLSPNHLTLCFASDRWEQVVSQLSQAILVSVTRALHPQSKHLPRVLHDLTRVENRPSCLTEMAYEWCSVICENYSSVVGGEELLPLALEVGFRHLDPQGGRIAVKLTHTEHHRELADIIFESKDYEAIADLLCAWTSRSSGHQPSTLLKAYAGHLVGLSRTQSSRFKGQRDVEPLSSRRLQRHAIRAVGLIGFQGFKEVGVVGFCGLLDKLHVSVEDVDRESKSNWVRLLADTINSTEGIQHLSHPHWEFLTKHPEPLPLRVAQNPDIIASLEGNQDWDKLECWMGVVWMLWPLISGKMKVEDLQRATLSLFRQRPGAIQKLRKWMGQRSPRTLETFQQICNQASPEAARQDIPYVFADNRSTL